MLCFFLEVGSKLLWVGWTCWEDSLCQPRHTETCRGKTVCLLRHPLPPATLLLHSIFKKCATTSPLFPFALKVTGIFPEEGILQIQMVTSSAPTEVSTKSGAHRNAPCAEMRLQSSVLLRHQRLPPLQYPKINILKRQVFSLQFLLK